MRRTAVSAILIAAIGALLLMAAGCGGDDDESAADTQAAAASTTDDANTTAGETEAAETEAEEPDFANAANCKEFTDLGQKVSAALGGSGGVDADETKELLNEFADEAPEEIRDDFKVIADAYSKIAEALEDVDLAAGETPSAEDALKLQEAASEIDQAELQEANDNITTWVAENCRSE